MDLYLTLLYVITSQSLLVTGIALLKFCAYITATCTYFNRLHACPNCYLLLYLLLVCIHGNVYFLLLKSHK
jgi:hypothetical protein